VATPTVYEVRCERCRTSFPPETKRCFHCGGPLGPGLGAMLRPGPLPGAPEPDADADVEILHSRSRNVLWVVTAVLALAVSLLRSCLER